jgi:predicted GNAT family N-acyltransferase
MSAVTCRRVANLTDWANAVAIRLTVFVDEQRVPFDEELDEHDRDAVHVLAYQAGRAVGTGRLIVAGTHGVVGRMAVLADARGTGVGSAVLEVLLAEARERGVRSVQLAAQLHARPFYARFGFVASGRHFLDAGIWHQRMDLALEPGDAER